MIIFAVPKAFNGIFGQIQINALRSWLAIRPKPKIILLGNEEGVADIVNKFNLGWIRDLQKNKYGTPLLSDIFRQINENAHNKLMMYVNADILLFDFPVHTLQQLMKKHPRFLVVGKRLEKRVNTFINPDKIVINTFTKGLPYKSPSWIDYFVFSPKTYTRVPPFALGRTFWDKWLVGNALARGVPVIDGTADICAIHQTHTYGSNKNRNRSTIWAGEEALKNLELAQGWGSLATIADASFRLINGKISPTHTLKKNTTLIQIIDSHPRLWPAILTLRLMREQFLSRG